MGYVNCYDRLGLCHKVRRNNTFYEFHLYHDDVNSKEFVPMNSFCKWDIDIDPSIQWSVMIYRYASGYNLETITVTQESDMIIDYTDAQLRAMSFTSYTADGKVNMTSRAKLDVRRQTETLHIYAKANFGFNGAKTFVI